MDHDDSMGRPEGRFTLPGTVTWKGPVAFTHEEREMYERKNDETKPIAPLPATQGRQIKAKQTQFSGVKLALWGTSGRCLSIQGCALPRGLGSEFAVEEPASARDPWTRNAKGASSRGRSLIWA